MTKWESTVLAVIVMCASASDVMTAGPSANSGPSPQTPLPVPVETGTFSAQKEGATFHVSFTGHTLTSRGAVENYLAYRAAELTKNEHADWFLLVEHRKKDDTVPASKPDPAGPRFSFRMAYWRPAWRFKTTDAKSWTSWSPFSGTAFFLKDSKTITAYQVGADISLRKGAVASDNPLAFDANALSDFLVNQVSPPQ